jgi:endonuclease/exonuclease/phosphatase family metal-dependent hydrolase
MGRGAGFLRVLALMAAIGVLAGCELEPEPTPFSVLTFNLRHDADWWEERFELIADGIAELKPDLIGLQEVEIGIDQEFILRDLILERDPDLDYEIYAREKAGIAGALGEGIALFSLHGFAETELLELGQGRVAVWAHVIVGEEERSLDIMNTHLHADTDDAGRAAQAEIITDFLQDQAHQEASQILVGDMNAEPDSQTISNFKEEKFRDAFVEAQPDEDGFTSPVILGKDQPEQNFSRRIDYIFSRPSRAEGGSTLVVEKADVVLNEPRGDGLYPSDHLGVWAQMSIH